MAANNKYDVFISFKKSDEMGGLTPDFSIAQEIAHTLLKYKVNTFFSEDSLEAIGSSAYKADIDNALDSAKIMIVVLTKAEYASSKWVKYEWDSFYNDYLSGVKKDAKLFSYNAGVNTQNLPFALRNVQNFSAESKTIDEVCEYISNALAVIQSGPLAQEVSEIQMPVNRGKLQKSSSLYTPTAEGEFKRLMIQAENSKSADADAINAALDSLKEKQNLNVLDIGCAYGFVGYSRFNNEIFSNVVGIDRDNECIGYAKKELENDKFSYYSVDITSDTFDESMEKIKEERGIKGFDIVYIATVIHHLGKDIVPKVLRNIRKHMSGDSAIIIRGFDDGSDLAYNDDGLLQKIIQLTMKAKGIEDRLHGRKIFGYLFNAGFNDIKIKSYMMNTADFDIDYRYLLYNDCFSWRLNDFEQIVENEPDNKVQEVYRNEMKELLELFENKFYEKNFWYCYYDYIGIAKK